MANLPRLSAGPPHPGRPEVMQIPKRKDPYFTLSPCLQTVNKLYRTEIFNNLCSQSVKYKAITYEHTWATDFTL